MTSPQWVASKLFKYIGQVQPSSLVYCILFISTQHCAKRKREKEDRGNWACGDNQWILLTPLCDRRLLYCEVNVNHRQLLQLKVKDQWSALVGGTCGHKVFFPVVTQALRIKKHDTFEAQKYSNCEFAVVTTFLHMLSTHVIPKWFPGCYLYSYFIL